LRRGFRLQAGAVLVKGRISVATIQFGPGVVTIAGQTVHFSKAVLVESDPPDRPPAIREIIFSCGFSKRYGGRRFRKAVRKIFAEQERRRRIESQFGVLVRRFPERHRC
jgi:hypothetical protein